MFEVYARWRCNTEELVICITSTKEMALEIVDYLEQAQAVEKEKETKKKEFLKRYQEQNPFPTLQNLDVTQEKIEYPQLPSFLQNLTEEERNLHPDYKIYAMARELVYIKNNLKAETLRADKKKLKEFFQLQKSQWNDKRSQAIADFLASLSDYSFP